MENKELKNNFYKAYIDLNEIQKETAREMFPDNYQELFFHFNGCELAIAAK